LYLEREQNIFLSVALISPYSKNLKKITGFGIDYQLKYFKEGICVFYKSEEEFESSKKHFSKLIKNKDPRIDEWFEKEKEYFEKAKHLNKIKDIEILIDTFENILLYNTVIPYRLMSAFKIIKGHEGLKRKLEEVRNRSLYPKLMVSVFKKVFQQVSKKLNITEKEAGLLTPQEVIDVIKKNRIISREELEKRNNGCYFYMKSGKVRFVFSEKDYFSKAIVNAKELKGTTAQKGKARGKVKIINVPEKMHKMMKGNILVSINTNPSIMPAIEKAGAIVTDEGGITCHAAIISRELSIPCIIATKNATKILKDGDYIEVDADKGIVRKIK
ncbi:PEP-utilizing enzyme, partial [Bacteroidota bacterium]